MKYFIIFLSLFMFGCSTRVVTKYEEVYIPIKCDVYVPQRPKRQVDNFEYLKSILIYTEQLEIVIKGCVNKQ